MKPIRLLCFFYLFCFPDFSYGILLEGGEEKEHETAYGFEDAINYIDEGETQLNSIDQSVLLDEPDDFIISRYWNIPEDGFELIDINEEVILVGEHATPLTVNGNTTIPIPDEKELVEREDNNSDLDEGNISSSDLEWSDEVYKRWKSQFHAVAENRMNNPIGLYSEKRKGYMFSINTIAKMRLLNEFNIKELCEQVESDLSAKCRRRKCYDICNVLFGVGIITKERRRKTYVWNEACCLHPDYNIIKTFVGTLSLYCQGYDIVTPDLFLKDFSFHLFTNYINGIFDEVCSFYRDKTNRGVGQENKGNTKHRKAKALSCFSNKVDFYLDILGQLISLSAYLYPEVFKEIEVLVNKEDFIKINPYLSNKNMRRLYDITTPLEALGFISKKGKNSWQLNWLAVF